MDKPAREIEIEDTAPLRAGPGNWWADSMCREHPTQWWFAGGQRETLLAKGICRSCAVRPSCLEFALGRPELLGVWAATTPTERAAIRRASRGVAVVEDDRHLDDARGARVDLDHVRPSDPEPARALVLAPAPDPAPTPVPEPDRGNRRGPGRGDGHDGRNELLTPAEAAHLLGVTPNTVTRWSRAGKVAAIQTMGGHRRFRRSEIERVLREANIAD